MTRVVQSNSHDLIVVGGGFTGLCTATMAVSENPDLSVMLIDENEPGLGAAYSTQDPDHRLNGPALVHSMLAFDLKHLMRWCHENEIVDEDPDSVTPYGLFIRRGDYAKYLKALLPTSVKVHRARVESVIPASGQPFEVRTSDGKIHCANAVVLALGNPPQHIPAPMRALADHNAIITDPWNRSQITAINPDASILMIGASLTAADQICTLLGQSHTGEIQMISRNGLRPQQWPKPIRNAPLPDMEAIMNNPPEPWVTDALNEAYTVRNLTRAIRKRVQFLNEQNEPWESAFYDVRDKVWQIWPRFSVKEKQRFLHRLRPFYDIHRFRFPPQTAQILADAEVRGQLKVRKAALLGLQMKNGQALATLGNSVNQRRETFDSVINCTGFDLTAQPSNQSLCGALLQSGHLCADPSGIGFQTDQYGHCLDRLGSSQARLRMIGPQTAGTWGDPLSVIFIGFQIRRMMPDLIQTLASHQHDKL